MAPVPRPDSEAAAATVLRARLMREDARCARERNQHLLRANEELRARLRRSRIQAKADPES